MVKPKGKDKSGKGTRMLLRLWVSSWRGNFVGECLELGLHVESDTLEGAKALIEEAVNVWLETANEVIESGKVPVVTPVAWYLLKKALWSLMMHRVTKPSNAEAWMHEGSFFLPAGV